MCFLSLVKKYNAKYNVTHHHLQYTMWLKSTEYLLHMVSDIGHTYLPARLSLSLLPSVCFPLLHVYLCEQAVVIKDLGFME